MPRVSKADLILQEARGRVEDAQNEVNDASKRFDISMAKLRAHQEAYVALERQLAREPRRPKSQPAPSAGARSPRKPKTDSLSANIEGGTVNVTPALTGKCAVPNCGLPESDDIHHPKFGEHTFHAKIKVKGSKKEPIVLPDDPDTFSHELVT